MPTSNVKDSAALEQLRSTFASNSECMENALNSFDGYLNETMCSMRDDYEYIDSRFKEAEAELDAAEAALDRCEASQRYDEEAGEYRPSCHGELNRYRAAKDKYDAYKHARDRADAIIKECEKKINEYNQNAKGILTEAVSESNRASSKLDEIIEKMNCYYSTSVGYSTKESNNSSQGTIKETPVTVPYSIKGSDVKGKINRWHFEQASEKLKNKNLCPKCQRVRPCQCDSDALGDCNRPKSPLSPKVSTGLDEEYYNGLQRPKTPVVDESNKRYIDAQIKIMKHNDDKEKMLKEMQWRQFQDYLQGKGSGN